VLPVRPLPVVAPPAQTANIYIGRTAAAEKHPLPQAGAPSRTDPFPSLPRFAFPAHGGDARRIFRGFWRREPVLLVREPEGSAGKRVKPRENVARSHKISVARNYPRQLTLSLVI
jgi:hypothetical protein